MACQALDCMFLIFIHGENGYVLFIEMSNIALKKCLYNYTSSIK